MQIKIMKKEDRGQVWVETVIYVLIGLSLIALVLAFVMPKINEKKDIIIVEQSIDSLNVFDDKINTVIETGQGNRRIIDFNMKKGELFFNTQDNKIVFVIEDLSKPYSELDKEINAGRIKIKTTKAGKTNKVELTLKYNGIDLTFDGKNNQLPNKFTRSSTPYRFAIENGGINGQDYIIGITQIS